MRSRYSAYVTHHAHYLVRTTHPSERQNYSKEEILQWATANQWQRLELIGVTSSTVEFKAYYLNSNNQAQVHHERSRFVFDHGEWYYLDGDYFENEII